MKNLMLAMCCLVLLEGCKSSKKMEKQPAPKKTMAAAHKSAVKKTVQKSSQKPGMKKHETNKPAEKAGAQKQAMKRHAMDKPSQRHGMQKASAQKGGAKKTAQKPGMHKSKKSEKDKAVVQKVGSSVGRGGL